MSRETSPEYYPIQFLNPLLHNQGVLLLDLASIPSRKSVIDQSTDSGHSVSSEPVQLLQVRFRLLLLNCPSVFCHTTHAVSCVHALFHARRHLVLAYRAWLTYFTLQSMLCIFARVAFVRVRALESLCCCAVPCGRQSGLCDFLPRVRSACDNYLSSLPYFPEIL